jgi:lipoprotein-anchoring transpeptidase ErfK/SrfK
MKAMKNRLWFRHVNRLQGSASFVLLISLLLPTTSLLALEASPAALRDEVPNEWIASWVDDLKHSNQRWIEVSISGRTLTAWEGGTPVRSFTVSTGREDEPTLPGVFQIEHKLERAWMQGDGYDIPNVPYTMYYSGSYAIHGAYWHSDFGSAISNGCINLPVGQAAWLFDWADIGTTVVIEP